MKIYITFGQIHHHFVNGQYFTCNTVAVLLNCRSQNDGMNKANELFDDKWSMIYTDKPNMDYYPDGLITIN